MIEALRGRSDLALELLDQQRGLPATEEARLIELIERADARFQAQSLREEGDLEGAIAVLQAAAEVWPDDAPIAHALADVFMEDGRPREALPWYGKARSIDPSNIWTVLAEANCLALLTAWDPAAYLLDELGEELDPAQQAMARDIRLRALREEADRLRDSWENKAAFEIYARLLKIEPDADVLTSLGGLYLRQAQPGLAEAFYADALVLDPDNFQAKLGRIRALDQLGRTREGWKLIREMPEDDPDVRDLLEVLEVRMVVQAGDDARIDGRYEDADELLRKLLDRYPLNPDGRALLAALRLDQQRYDEALEIATEVLAEQPVHGRALAVTTEVALFQGRSDLIEELYLSALFDGQELWIRDGLANARLSALVEETERLTNRGEVERARNLVQGATSWLDEDPGRMSLVGRGYLAVGLPDDAELLFDKALVQDPDHSGAIIGKANTKRDRGWVAGAEKYLTIEAVRTEDPLIWMALARVQADRGYRTRAQTSLQQALTLPPAETSLRTWTADGRLPALPLPSGTAPQDLPPTQQAEVMTVMPYTNLQSLEAELSTKDEPGFQAEFGAWSRPGSDGTSNLLAGMGHVGMLDYALPGLVLDVEANPVVATDGWHRVAGVGLGARIRTSPTLPRGASLELGTNPLGFGGFDLHGRLAGRVSLRPGGEFGMSVSRSPITDSVTSWAGIEDADGDDFGRVAFNALSTWLIRDAILSPMDAGLVVHGGLLTGLQLERALRVEAYGWWGWTLDEDIWWARGGLDGYWLSDRPSVDGWAPPDAGAFSPEAFGSLVARVDGEVMLPELPLGLCGGISAGLQVLQQEQVLLDDGEEEIWFDQGLSGIAEARLGGQALLGDQWRLLVEGRWTMVGTVFRERTGVIHLERVSKARRDALPRDALISQGRVPSTLLACKRPTPTAYRPQDYADHVAP